MFPHIEWLKTGQLGKMGYSCGEKDVRDLQLERIARRSFELWAVS